MFYYSLNNGGLKRPARGPCAANKAIFCGRRLDRKCNTSVVCKRSGSPKGLSQLLHMFIVRSKGSYTSLMYSTISRHKWAFHAQNGSSIGEFEDVSDDFRGIPYVPPLGLPPVAPWQIEFQTPGLNPMPLLFA